MAPPIKQAVQEISPYGWGLTLVAMILQVYGPDKDEKAALRKEVEELRRAVSALSSDMQNTSSRRDQQLRTILKCMNLSTAARANTFDCQP
jgi:hypothetical protein